MKLEERRLVRSAKAGGGLTFVRYDWREATGKQKRFKGRWLLVPHIDLKAYKCRAVIDWIDVEFITGRPTQMRHLQAAAVKAGVPVPYITQRDGDRTTHTGTTWVIRFQDIEPRKLVAAIKTLAGRFDNKAEPEKMRVVGLEVAVDFYPRSLSAEDRAQLVGVLRRSIMPEPAVKQKLGYRELPRTVGSSEKPVWLVPPGGEEQFFDLVRSAYSCIDDTFYIGKKKGPWMIRVQDKWSDERRAGTQVVLPEDRRRARFEVTLSEAELGRLGVSDLGHLSRFSVTRLQGRYFSFFHPTFPERPRKAMALGEAVSNRLLEREVDRFMDSGVIGLRWHRSAVVAFRAKARRDAPEPLRDLFERKRQPRPRKTVHDTDKAFDELNALVQEALKDLHRRLERAFKPGS